MVSSVPTLTVNHFQTLVFYWNEVQKKSRAEDHINLNATEQEIKKQNLGSYFTIIRKGEGKKDLILLSFGLFR